MSELDGFLFNDGHLWCREREAGVYEVGISDHAQRSLGDIMYFDLPEPGQTIDAGESFGTVESVKVVNDLIGPVSGSVLEVNPAIEDDPAAANRDPYGAGWLLAVHGSAPPEGLMDADAYARYVGE